MTAEFTEVFSKIVWRIGYLSVFFSFLLVVLYSLSYHRFNATLKSLYFYLVFWFLTELLSYFVVHVLSISNYFLYHFFYISQFITLSFFYYFLLRIKTIKWITVIVLLFIGVKHIIEPEILLRFNEWGLFLSSLVLIAYAMIYFFRLLTVEKTIYLYVNFGIFLNILVTVLVFATVHLVSIEDFYFLNKFNVLFNFIFQILVFIEWYQHHRHFTKNHAN